MKNDELENARVKYQVALDLFKSEGQIQWTRYSAMLLVNTVFIGLIGFAKDIKFHGFFQQLIQLPLLGLILCYLWFRMTHSGFTWMKFWISEARELEKQLKDKDQINPITKGNEFRLFKNEIINTERASYTVILIIFLIYFFMLINNAQ